MSLTELLQQNQLADKPKNTMGFTVSEILDENTIRIYPAWVYEGMTGNLVVIDEYDITNSSLPPQVAKNVCKQRLASLLIPSAGKIVPELTLATPAIVIQPQPYDPPPTAEHPLRTKLKCRVLLNGTSLATFFPDFKKK